MRKKFGATVFFLSCLISARGAVWAQLEIEKEEVQEEGILEEEAPEEVTPSFPETSPTWVSSWEEAKALAEQGEYLKAREIYEALLENPEAALEADRIQEEYETLQMKILFSPLETPESFLHTIEPGDSLYELAKKYHTTVELLRKSNQIKGDVILAGKTLKIPKAQFSIEIEKGQNRLTLLADGKPLKRYAVATGTDGSTPAGTFKIVNKLENPTWYKAGAIVPPDSPENILGTRWLGFDTPGYGIHGTTLPETIGTQASKGCVRMLNAEVEEIYDIVPLDTLVTVKE